MVVDSLAGLKSVCAHGQATEGSAQCSQTSLAFPEEEPQRRANCAHLCATGFCRNLMTVGFSFDDEPTANSQDELAVATNGSSMGSADLFFKVCGSSHRLCPIAADLHNTSALRLLVSRP